MFKIIRHSFVFGIYFILLTYYAESRESDNEVMCEPPWEKVHRSCVWFVKNKPFSTWQTAREFCKKHNGELLCINDMKEKNNTETWMRNHVKSKDLMYWWVGLKLLANGTWFWVDKEEFNRQVTDWESGAGKTKGPDGLVLQNRCSTLFFRGYLKDEDCNNTTRPFICELMKVKTTTSTEHAPTTTSSTSTTTTTTTSSTDTTIKMSKSTHTLPSISVPSAINTDRIFSTTGSTPAGTSSTSLLSTKTSSESLDVSSETSTIHLSRETSEAIHSTSLETTERTTKKQTYKLPDNLTDKTNRYFSKTTEPTKESDIPTKHITEKPTNKPTVTPARSQTSKATTELSAESTEERKIDKDEFVGCYSVNFGNTCPPVEAFGISWSRTEPGKPTQAPCNKGHAKWFCDKNPTCWRGEPDVKHCTSETIQDLTNKLEEVLRDPEHSEKAVEFTESLASSAGPNKSLSEQDIFQSTKLMNAAAKAKPKNSTEAKNIIKNVAKCGSNLVASDKKTTWSSMSRESQITVASSLLNSMETVTKQMLASFDTPTVESIKEDNMAIELQVVNVSGTDARPVEYRESSNNFAVPVENLKKFSTGGLARLIFISYNNIGDVLKPDGARTEHTARDVISQVVSASIGDKSSDEPLSKPITFTMSTQEKAKGQEWKQLCSFWNFSLGYTGAWSQKGCTIKEYNSTHTTCECNHLTNFAILMDIHSTKLSAEHATTLSYITYVGLIISIICLFLSWITFVCVRSHSSIVMGDSNEYGSSSSGSSSATVSRSAQGERNSIHKNLVFCLFVAEILFLAGIERTNHKSVCAVIAGLLHYFFTAGFTWMFVEGIHILFMLVQVFDAAKSRLKFYYLIGYGIPLIVCGVSAALYYEGYGTDKYCWLTSERMFIWSFAGPVAFILLVNLVVLIYAMSAVCKHSEYVFTKDKSRTGNIRAWIQGALALEVLLGLTWIFGYFYISEQALPVAYLFTIFNSLQGLFIFVFHCILNKKVRKEYQRLLSYSKMPVSSATHSSTKGYHHTNGSGPHTASYNMSGGRKNSAFDSNSGKERRQSTKSTTAA